MSSAWVSLIPRSCRRSRTLPWASRVYLGRDGFWARSVEIDGRVEGELLQVEDLLDSRGAPTDMDRPTAHAERGAEAVKEQGLDRPWDRARRYSVGRSGSTRVNHRLSERLRPACERVSYRKFRGYSGRASDLFLGLS
jgi:hypothetical protein